LEVGCGAGCPVAVSAVARRREIERKWRRDRLNENMNPPFLKHEETYSSDTSRRKRC
jgi:hypothetical protein